MKKKSCSILLLLSLVVLTSFVESVVAQSCYSVTPPPTVTITLPRFLAFTQLPFIVTLNVCPPWTYLREVAEFSYEWVTYPGTGVIVIGPSPGSYLIETGQSVTVNLFLIVLRSATPGTYSLKLKVWGAIGGAASGTVTIKIVSA